MQLPKFINTLLRRFSKRYRNHLQLINHLDSLLKKLKSAYEPGHPIWQTYDLQQTQKVLDEAKRL